MGVLKNIIGQAKAVAEAAADMRARMPNPADAPSMGAGAVEPAGQRFEIINPTPQDEVDRLTNAGGVVRGVVGCPPRDDRCLACRDDARRWWLAATDPWLAPVEG